MEETLRSDKIVIMDGGKIAMEGRPTEIFSRTKEFEELDLKLPFAVELTARLRERGLEIPDGLLTDEALADYLAGQKTRLSKG
jgi:energy-coupling factor transport system ATP-binding protein